MLSFFDALEKCRAAAQSVVLGREDVALDVLAGRVCAAEMRAPLSIQPFDNAAMDGYALRVADIAAACGENPVHLPVAGVVAAGGAGAPTSLPAGACMKIMTGAPMPDGAEAVVPVELAQTEAGAAVFTAPALAGAHIRRAGEDFIKGAPILRPGQRLGAAAVLPLATLGLGRVPVFKKPRVAFLATGRELVDDFSQPLAYGQIYNSNRAYARAALAEMGADVVLAETIRDDESAFAAALEKARAADVQMIVSSGAVSAGDYDFVRPNLDARGAEILYHKIKLKPGKPNLLARLPDGTLYFGLPGNPVATAAGLRFFVQAALACMYGLPPEKPLRAQAMTAIRKKQGLHLLLKAKMEMGAQGQLLATALDGQESFMVRPFLDMNAWLSFPEECGAVAAGEMVDVYPLSAASFF